ncbi:MAG: hypothetical protein CYPHOPRED_005158 [Cyphobasidiales sp. Tagirdzhanova-0007]|nr:MAG: hypothetical protein CYPHOPRED_005158 [Cyphobasidiales sp. Tagirdzhanova-0007]
MKKFIVISGGQTGVDLAALYAAEASSLPISGWVPLHYTNETGAYGIPSQFRAYLKQTATTASAERTELNLSEADGVLTLLRGEAVEARDEGEREPSSSSSSSSMSPGTQYGLNYARTVLGKSEAQLCFVDLAKAGREDLDLVREQQRRVARWIRVQGVERCAVGGPRESEAPGIADDAYAFLIGLFELLQGGIN